MAARASCKDQEAREPGLFAKQGSRLHAKMLSKEAAAQLAAPSFRVYYPVASAGAVPFLWESQPGTPKDDSPSAAALPPLTPPPSYYAKKGAGAGAGRSSKKRRGAIFSYLRRPQHQTAPCNSSSSSSWSTTSSSSSSTMSPVFTVGPPSPAARGDDDERCFGVDRDRGIVKGCSVVGAVRNALATVVGGRRAATTAAA